MRESKENLLGVMEFILDELEDEKKEILKDAIEKGIITTVEELCWRAQDDGFYFLKRKIENERKLKKLKIIKG